MKLKEITVTVIRTRQIKQYEPLVITQGAVLILEPGDDERHIRRAFTRRLVLGVEASMNQLVAELQAKMKGTRHE